MNMGQSIAIKGELSGAEDLTLEGQVEGKIHLPENVLTVGKSARINAEIIAKAVIVLGQLAGNVTVKEKFELRAGGSMQGNVKAPRIAMADGAVFNGKVEMPGGKSVPEAAAGTEAPGRRRVGQWEIGVPNLRTRRSDELREPRLRSVRPRALRAHGGGCGAPLSVQSRAPRLRM